jgi:hypothetical protein
MIVVGIEDSVKVWQGNVQLVSTQLLFDPKLNISVGEYLSS